MVSKVVVGICLNDQVHSSSSHETVLHQAIQGTGVHQAASSKMAWVHEEHGLLWVFMTGESDECWGVLGKSLDLAKEEVMSIIGGEDSSTE